MLFRAFLFVSLFSGLAFAKLTVGPKKTFPGGVVLAKYALKTNETANDYSLKVNGRDVPWAICPFKNKKGPSELCAFVGVAMDDGPKAIEVVVDPVASDGGGKTARASVPVRPRKYPTGKLSVDPSRTHLSPEDQARADDERAKMKTIYEATEGAYLWDGSFRLPGKGGTTSPFGVQRTFNGKVASTHYGLDVRGNEQTRVLASNAGKVVFADNLFYSGNFVAIDHGLGLFTTYSHLTSFAVKPGELVKTGQTLGQAGATGRVTGPHIHFAVRIRGLYVDPREFLKISAR